jgi:hypothetical protein
LAPAREGKFAERRRERVIHNEKGVGGRALFFIGVHGTYLVNFPTPWVLATPAPLGAIGTYCL